MSDDTNEWKWADTDGAQKDIDEWELIASLSDGTLPFYALVWKRGWAGWLHACQVGELASAIPSGKFEAAVAPEQTGATVPPPPPLDRYAAYQARKAGAELLGGAARSGGVKVTPPPPPVVGHGVSRGAVSAAALMGRAASVAPPPPPMRPPMPTIAEESQTLTSTATLRPPGAVPPPPRRVPAAPTPLLHPGLAGGSALDTPLPDIAIREMPDEPLAPPATAVSAPAAPVTSQVAPEPAPAAPMPNAALPPEPTLPALTAEPLPTFESAAPLEAPAAPSFAPPPPAALDRQTPWVVILAAIAGALGALVIVLIVARRETPSPTAAPIPEAVAPATRATTATPTGAPSRGACTLARPAERLAAEIAQGVPPLAADAGDGSRIAIGFAATTGEAVGLLIDPTTLAVERAFDDQGAAAVEAVVPERRDGKTTFAVHRAGARLTGARAVDGPTRFTLGMSEEGLARVEPGKAPVVVWPGGAGEKFTDLRVATTPKGDHAVTFRRGGQSGDVLVGWLGADGARARDLERVGAPAMRGTPMVAANADSVLVVFAARATASDHWGVQLALGTASAPPRDSKPFTIPPGGPGREAISPSAAGLGSGWLLQWTEGSAGRHEVRVQTLDDALLPIGEPVTVSPTGANAGQGVVWIRGTAGLSLFLVARGQGHELWGALLKCP